MTRFIPFVPSPAFTPSDDLWEQQTLNIGQVYSDLGKIEVTTGNAGLRIHSVEIAEKNPETAVLQIGTVLSGTVTPVFYPYRSCCVI